MTREYPENTELATPDQWTVLERGEKESQSEHHRWRLVYLSNRQGIIRPGMECVICRRVEVLTNSQVRGHGRRIERSEK